MHIQTCSSFPKEKNSHQVYVYSWTDIVGYQNYLWNRILKKISNDGVNKTDHKIQKSVILFAVTCRRTRKV